VEVYPFQHGWRVTQRAETIMMNGGIHVVPMVVNNVLLLHRKSWAEVVPGGG
jgi:hypothetical protein